MATEYDKEPVLNKEGEPCWLTVTKEEKPILKTPKGKKAIKKTIKENKPPEMKTIYKFILEPEGTWQCNKCKAIIKGNHERPIYCDEEQGGCNRKSTFTPVTKMINPNLWKLPKYEDISMENLDMLGIYEDMVSLIKKLLVFSDEMEYKVFALWIMSTWKLETWDAVGFPIFIGIPDSGKSRALRIIHNLAYRAPKASGIKAAAIPRLCHYWNITLLIDEAHNKMNTRKDSGSEILDFVKDSYKRDSIYITCDNNDQEKLIVTKNFGFEAFAGEKSFNTGLISRGLIFWMDKATPEISKLTYVKDELGDIRTKLLNYRFKYGEPEDLGNDFCLTGRTREIYESIISTGKHIGLDVKEIIEFAKRRDKREEEALQGTVECQILEIIKNFKGDITLFPDDATTKIKTDTIIGNDGLNWLTGDKKEDKDSRQKLGYILKNMGIVTKRESEGRMIFLQDESNSTRLNKLYKRYKV